MSTVLPFIAKRDLDAQQNLIDYIAFNRANNPFTGVNWDDDCWNVSEQIEQRGRAVTTRLRWSTWEDREKKATAASLDEHFVDFAKAFVCAAFRERRLLALNRHLSALRLLETALKRSGDALPLNTNHTSLTLAATLLGETLSPSSAWGVGRSLEKIAEVLANLGVATARHWKSPHRWQGAKRSNSVSPETTEATAGKLPDVRSIVALGDIFATSTNPADIVTTAFAALAMVAPARVGEILTLPVDCIATVTDEAGADGIAREITGLRWRPEKGGAPKTNFCVGKDATNVTLAAIEKLVKIGRSARVAAAWYEQNPDQVYLPPGFEHLRGTPLTLIQMAAIVGRLDGSVPRACKAKLVFGVSKIVGRIGRTHPLYPKEAEFGAKYVGVYDFAEFEKHVLSRLGDFFPYADRNAGLKFSEALFCLPMNVLRPDAVTLSNVPSMISQSMIAHQLGSNPNDVTVFSRNGKTHGVGRNSTPFKITTHQFRHLLNTLAQSKHLSQALIAFWSGRKNVHQNEWYNHIPQEAFIEAYTKLEKGAPELQIDGPLATKVRQSSEHNAIDLKTALQSELGAVIVTRYGICRHDYALTPCPRDKDCIGCGEHLFTKGSAAQLQEAREQLIAHEKAVANATQALTEGRLGAQRWLDRNQSKLHRWQQAVDKLTDESIPDGTLITLDAPAHPQSKTGLAFAARNVSPARSAAPTPDANDIDAADQAVRLGIV